MFAIAKIEQGAQEVLVDVCARTPHDRFYACVDLLSDSRLNIYEQNLTMLEEPQVPSRFSERIFSRVAPFIGHALISFPNAVEVKSQYANRTMQRLLEEGLTAKRRYGHFHKEIDEALWRQHNACLGTSERDGILLLGPKDQLRRAKNVSIGTAALANSVPEYAITPTESSLRALAQLLAANAFNPRPTFFVRGVDATLRSILEKQYDVIFTPDEVDAEKYYIA